MDQGNLAAGHGSRSDSTPQSYTLAAVARHLDISTESLQRLRRRFSHYLGPEASLPEPHFSSADVAAIVTIQKLLAQGYDDEQIDEHLTPVHLDVEPAPDFPTTVQPYSAQPYGGDVESASALPQVVGDVLNTIVTGQQAVLNGQTSLRDMMGVVVQDNFNLKDENRKLRDRMLEMERALAEYQRREETRKERMEGRMRALEATVAALQQQVAQLVQIQRQQQRKRGWFG
jgi:flagellar capping protein FliD